MSVPHSCFSRQGVVAKSKVKIEIGFMNGMDLVIVSFDFSQIMFHPLSSIVRLWKDSLKTHLMELSQVPLAQGSTLNVVTALEELLEFRDPGLNPAVIRS